MHCLSLVQVGILLASYDVEIVPLDFDVTLGSHMLYGGENLHAMQRFDNQPPHVCVFLKTNESSKLKMKLKNRSNELFFDQ